MKLTLEDQTFGNSWLELQHSLALEISFKLLEWKMGMWCYEVMKKMVYGLKIWKLGDGEGERYNAKGLKGNFLSLMTELASQVYGPKRGRK